MLNDSQVTQFHRQGFVNGGPLLDAETVETLRAELQRVVDEQGQKGQPQPVRLQNIGKTTPIWQIVDIWRASAPFRQVMALPSLTEVIAQLMHAAEVRLWHDQVQYKPATVGGVNMWHQDCPYWGIIQPDTQITAWIALDDVAEDNGCMSMVPGSHRWGNQIEFLHSLADYEAMPESWEGHPLEVRRCPVGKGHVHFHHGLTWHGSHANTSGRPRRAIAFHFMGPDTTYVAAGNHVMKPYVTVADGDKLQGEMFPLVWPQS